MVEVFCIYFGNITAGRTIVGRTKDPSKRQAWKKNRQIRQDIRRLSLGITQNNPTNKGFDRRRYALRPPQS